MAFKPDYGLRLRKDGVGPQVKHYFYKVPLHGFDVAGIGQFTVCLDVPYAGEIHALSLDFTTEHLVAILSLVPSSVRQDIMSSLHRDPNTPRSVQFPVPVNCDHICATLGQIQHGPYESYIPLIVSEIEVGSCSDLRAIPKLPERNSSSEASTRGWLRSLSLWRKN